MYKRDNTLPNVAFNILLALSLKQRHGYEIMKQVEEDSKGKIKLGPGALYTSIKQLNDQALIKEVVNPTDYRRRYYELTKKGATRLNAEVQYYENAVSLARQRQILTVRALYV